MPLKGPTSGKRRFRATVLFAEQTISPLLLGDFKHAQSFIFLQEFVLGFHLFSEILQLLLLLFGAQADTLHAFDQLVGLHKFSPQLVQQLVDLLAVFIHAKTKKWEAEFKIY